MNISSIKNLSFKALLSCLIFCLFPIADVLAQEIALQGILRNQSGRAVDDGNYSLTFNMYDAETGGNQVWTETQPTVSVSQGIYSVYLGSVINFENVAFDKQYWLGISINGGQELSPRVKLARNPYALGILGTSNVFTSNGNVGIGTTTPNNKLEVIGNAYLSGNLAIGQGSALTFNDGTSLTTGALSQVRSDQFVDFYINKADNAVGNLHMRFGSAEDIKYNFSPSELNATTAQWRSNGAFINSEFNHNQYLSFQRDDKNRWTLGTLNEQTGDGLTGVGGHDLFIQRFNNNGDYVADHMTFRRNGTTVFGGQSASDAVVLNNHKVKIINSDVSGFGNQALNIDFGAGQFLEVWKNTDGSPIIENSGGNLVFGTWSIGDLHRSIGIGDTNPTEAKLTVVNGFDHSVTFTNEYYVWQDFDAEPDNYGLVHPLRNDVNGSSTFIDLSIWASNGIAANFYVVYSDERTKKIIGKSDSKADLQTLNKIKVTDYKLKDVLQHGNQTFKKVIAQQVEEVYPMAVSEQTNFIPSIYAAPKKVSKDKNGKSKIITKAPHDLSKGDLVRFFDHKTPKEIRVAEVIDDYTFTLVENLVSENVFVYGKQVDDFKSVDYEAISMLNVSATQELYKQIQELQSKVEQLEKNQLSLKANNQQLEARLDNIEALLQNLTKPQSKELKTVTAQK